MCIISICYTLYVFVVYQSTIIFSMETKKVLVCFGARNREVKFTSSPETTDMRSLDKAIREVFKDIPVVTLDSRLVLQASTSDICIRVYMQA